MLRKSYYYNCFCFCCCYCYYLLLELYIFRNNTINILLFLLRKYYSDRDSRICEEQSIKLSLLVNKFILRRTNNLLSKHLPPKLVQIVVCDLTPLQRELYNHFLSSKATSEIINGGKKTVSSIKLFF